MSPAIFAPADLGPKVKDIPPGANPTPAVRPLNPRLDHSSFSRTSGFARPDWRSGLNNVLRELAAY
ncbi:sugar nucleotide-binding protein [Antarctobacter sp.]|uniref:sugar nucleotide-binding protein n=1 Tax=Antarctobacter sp. TaxID=1872577 RepID=UPI003A5C4BB1